jgi:hypothetical protein
MTITGGKVSVTAFRRECAGSRPLKTPGRRAPTLYPEPGFGDTFPCLGFDPDVEGRILPAGPLSAAVRPRLFSRPVFNGRAQPRQRTHR